MRSGRLLFLDDGNALGARAIPTSLAPSVDRVTNLVDFLEALQSSHYEIALIRADRGQMFGKSGEAFRRQLIESARQCDVMTAVMVQSMNVADCDKLISDGFDDVLYEPRHVSQFEAQLRSIRRIAMMRRELNRRHATLRKFLAIVNDVDVNLCFGQDEPALSLNDAEIVLLDLDPAKSGATTLYPQLRVQRHVNYFDDLEQAQAKVFRGQTGMLIINAVGKAEAALAMIANMRASATLYNYPVLLVVQSEESPASEQVFAAGASDYIEGEISIDAVVPRLQSLLRHEQLRHQLAAQCESPAEAIVHDNLTGFYSFGFARAHLQQFEGSMKEHGLPLTAAVISLDNIKRINDEFGFAAGDSIIRQAAVIVRNCVRGEDLVARISGAKFLLMFPESELTQARFAMSRINSILQYTTLTLPGADDNLQVVTSFKIKQWTPGDTLDSLIFNSAGKQTHAA
jgi:two-component system, cell cycle response regulator